MCIPGMDNFQNPLREALKEMEKYNEIQTVFAPGCVEPGIDNFQCPMREAIKRLEKQ